MNQRKGNRVLVLLLQLCISMALQFATTWLFASEQAFIPLDNTTKHIKLGSTLYYFAEEKPLTLNDIKQPGLHPQFQSIDQDEPNLGFVEGGYWFRLRLHNTQDPEGGIKDWLLELDYSFLDHIEYYSPTDGPDYEQVIVGDIYPFDARDIDLHSHVFPLHLEPGDMREIYFRVETTTSLQMPLELWSPNRFVESNALKFYWTGIFYGMMLAMILYNFFVYLSVRDPAYIHYICYISCITLINMIITGLAFQKIWPSYPFLANTAFAIFCPITIFFALSFTRSFLQTKLYYGAIDKLLITASGICLIAISFPLFLSPHISIILAVFLPIPTCLIIFITGAYGVVIKQRRAYFYMAAWGTMIIGFVARALLQFDLVPNVFFTAYGTQIGALIEVLLLSLALADRINTEKADRVLAVEKSLIAAEKQRKTEDVLAFQSLHDQLTGSPNRVLCGQRLQEIIESNETSDSRLLVCTIHLTNFHDINFTLGHQAGDEILIEAIHSLNRELSSWPGIQTLNEEKNTSTYLGIIEGVYLTFIVACEPDEEEHVIVESLSKKLSHPIHFNDMTLDLGGHIGLACWPQDDINAVGLIRKSMIAVRAAKWSKLPIVSYDVNIDQYSESRLSLMGELLDAINNDELTLHYQPKIDLSSQTIVSIEALVRWHHPKHGLLSPNHFIDIAESTGIIQPLTQWVINTGINYCNTLRKQGHDLSIAINVSVRNLLSETFADDVIALLKRHDFPAERLILEVIESAVIEDMNQTFLTLSMLKKYGIGLSLDDFGTGYSSLSYLKNLPFHELKIDRSFVTNMSHDEGDRVIVETTLTIAHQLGLRVVAEGIEDQATLDSLATMGCEIGQGYFILKPKPGDQLLEWLENNTLYQTKVLV